jgi:hypothetical protein
MTALFAFPTAFPCVESDPGKERRSPFDTAVEQG